MAHARGIFFGFRHTIEWLRRCAMFRLETCGRNPLGLYRVREGDTLSSVCARFGVPPALVAAENGLQAFPPAGALLLLPDPAGMRTYTVGAGETVASVCAKFGLSEREFCEMNACGFVYPTQVVLVGKG